MVYEVKKEEAGSQMGISHLVAIASDDDDEKEIDAREQERVNDEPNLSEDRIEMLLMKF